MSLVEYEEIAYDSYINIGQDDKTWCLGLLQAVMLILLGILMVYFLILVYFNGRFVNEAFVGD